MEMERKTYLQKEEIWYIIRYMAEHLRRSQDVTTFEDLISGAQKIADEKSEDDLLNEARRSGFVFAEDFHVIKDIPCLNEMLGRYIRFKDENGATASIGDISEKSASFSGLVKGYLHEVLVFFAGSYGIHKDGEITEREISGKIMAAAKDMVNRTYA